mmetsp:Transcript_49471/g.143488  ORF Transcript_49471/g.143488 Transcript_49471/m.143488 type:complete len:213 (+) Transcript_49471:518-1156(+)
MVWAGLRFSTGCAAVTRVAMATRAAQARRRAPWGFPTAVACPTSPTATTGIGSQTRGPTSILACTSTRQRQRSSMWTCTAGPSQTCTRGRSSSSWRTSCCPTMGRAIRIGLLWTRCRWTCATQVSMTCLRTPHAGMIPWGPLARGRSSSRYPHSCTTASRSACRTRASRLRTTAASSASTGSTSACRVASRMCWRGATRPRLRARVLTSRRR